jgi:CBS domain-containing protein
LVAKDLISSAVLPLKTSDTGEEALELMSDFHVRHLPIVNNNEILGLLSEDDIYAHDVNEPVGSYALSTREAYVKLNDHIFELMSLMAEYDLTTVPVVDEKDVYIGIITLEDLLHYYASSFSFKEPGSILVLKMNKQDYSLAEISRIIEMENATIIGTFISNIPETTNILVTLKINKQEISKVVTALNRYEYEIAGTYTESSYVNMLKDRYDMLLSYLDI